MGANTRSTSPPPRLFGRDRNTRNKLRHPFVAAREIEAVQGLELVRRKGVRRRALHQSRGPCPETREFLDMSDPLYPVQEEIALQERRVGGVHQRVPAAVE